MIKLTDRLSVTADKHQYIVGTPRQITQKSGGAPVTKLDNPRYCKTLAQALRVAVGLEMRRGIESGELETLTDFALRLDQITADFEAKLSGFEI